MSWTGGTPTLEVFIEDDAHKGEVAWALANVLGREPIDGRQGLLPLGSPDLVRIGQVATPYDIDDGRAEHARRRVDQKEYPLSSNLEACEVLAVAITDVQAFAVSRCFVRGQRGGQAGRVLLQ